MAHTDAGPITFVVPGDLHLTEPGLENHRVAHWAMDEINRVVRPDFVAFIGDNVQDATEAQFRLFNALRSRLDVPHFALVGDHDVHGDPAASGFRHHVDGSTYGSSSLRGFRILRLDTQQARPLGMSADQVAWLRGEFDRAEAAGEAILVFQHNYPFQIWETFDGPGIDAWRSLVQSRRIVAVVTGHTHYHQVANDGRNIYVAVRSIGDPEGGPPGFLIGHAEGDDLAFTYRSIEDKGPTVMVTHPRATLLATGPEHVVRGADSVRAKTWSDAGIRSARYRVDDGEWRLLESRGEGCWEAPLPGDHLAKGEHHLIVEATDTDGRVGERRIAFPVDPTGRFTAVPAAWPVVTETAFC